jgi:hypothetical protein
MAERRDTHWLLPLTSVSQNPPSIHRSSNPKSRDQKNRNSNTLNIIATKDRKINSLEEEIFEMDRSLQARDDNIRENYSFLWNARGEARRLKPYRKEATNLRELVKALSNEI